MMGVRKVIPKFELWDGEYDGYWAEVVGTKQIIHPTRFDF
jgi:hypothetical protein